MTQDDLKDYLLLPEHKCYVHKVKEKPEGKFFYFRREGSPHLAVVFPPKSGKYKEENVCHICKLLKAPIPDWAKSAEQTLDDIDKKYRSNEPESEPPQ